MAVYKNKASQKVACFAYDSTDGSAKTGDAANITAQISIDGAATAATNDVNPTELDATDAPGVYLFDLTQAETNGDLLVIAPVSATTSILVEPLLIYTEPEQRQADVTAVSGDSTAADNLELDYDGTGYAKANSTIGTCTTNTDMRGTDSAALATSLTTAQNDLDTITGSDGVTLATTQGNYAPATSTAMTTAQNDLDILTGTDGVLLATTGQPAGWPANLAASAGQIIKATVDTATNTHTPTTTEFQADDITEATADHYNGRVVIFTSGALAGQATDITDYEAVGGIGQFTVTAMTEAPANNDKFVIV